MSRVHKAAEIKFRSFRTELSDFFLRRTKEERSRLFRNLISRKFVRSSWSTCHLFLTKKKKRICGITSKLVKSKERITANLFYCPLYLENDFSTSRILSVEYTLWKVEEEEEEEEEEKEERSLSEKGLRPRVEGNQEISNFAG